MELFTRNGRPLQVFGDIVYTAAGNIVGKIDCEKVYGPDGTYVGTIVNDRLVSRSQDSGARQSAFSAGRQPAVNMPVRAPVAIQGEEPELPA